MTEFELKPEHIDLLCNAYISWQDCETGAPAIDCKRPYGNSSVASDIAEILGLEYDYETATDDDDNELLAWHYETETALQVILSTMSFEPGLYRRSNNYSNDWERVE